MNVAQSIAKVNKNNTIGLLCVRLYRPWLVEDFLDVLPASTKFVLVVEADENRDPLFTDVSTTLQQSFREVEINRACWGKDTHSNDEFISMAIQRSLSSLGRTPTLNSSSVGYAEREYETQQMLVFGSQKTALRKDGTLEAAKYLASASYQVRLCKTFDSYNVSSGAVQYRLRWDASRNLPVVCNNDSYVDSIVCLNEELVSKFEMVDSLKAGGHLVLVSERPYGQVVARFPANVLHMLREKRIKIHVIDHTPKNRTAILV